MVKGNLLPPDYTSQLPIFNCMSTSVEPVQPGCLPAFVNSGLYTFSANTMTSGMGVPYIPGLNTQQSNGAQGFSQRVRPVFQNLLPAVNPYLKEKLSAFGGEVAPNGIPGCQRRFFIFDQSGNETRLRHSSYFPIDGKPTIAARKRIGDSYLHYEDHAAKVNQINETVLKEVSDENHLSGEESEMHEDTEEINALLYSDDDDDYDDNDSGGDDEVISTGHSPIKIRSCETRGQVDEITEEVPSSDAQSKRRKLLDGGYKCTLLADTAGTTKVTGVHVCDDDDESSYAIGQNREEERHAIRGSKQLKKDKVHATLKILESIIPGAKYKDPLVVLDLAINYLESLKFKAFSRS
ncbi:transcription factor bHLH143 [Manihot esculenta]|uniref:BHLH domain-containing protein n=1 Tax=Manihot esculenta TaxID=3983 RepID=A0A2C9VI85_MANES|nr:transcription factor bHLH143 [Manihot esculenta]XP_021618229.1 transcription factor bHLH143 [Manihot esculenta]OAY45163.1 hypothetical protein MANES_07G037000v8 [Manihot esculenta]